MKKVDRITDKVLEVSDPYHEWIVLGAFAISFLLILKGIDVI